MSRTTRHFPNQRPLCHVQLLLANGSQTLSTLIDSDKPDGLCFLVSVGSITWELEERVKTALEVQPGPGS